MAHPPPPRDKIGPYIYALNIQRKYVVSHTRQLNLICIYFCIVRWNLKENSSFLKLPQKLCLYCFLLLVMLLFLGPVRHLRQLELIWFPDGTLILDDRFHCSWHQFVLRLRAALIVRPTAAWVTVILITTIHHTTFLHLHLENLSPLVLVLYHRQKQSVCSCSQTFYCWTSRLSCCWCMYMERFTFGHYLLAVSAYATIIQNALIPSLLLRSLTFNYSSLCGPWSSCLLLRTR